MQHRHSTTALTLLRRENARLRAELHAVSWSHFGVLTPAATRSAMRKVQGKRDIIVIDIRKMNALNKVLGYNRSSALVADLVQCRQAPGRPADIAGQYGGDEFVFVTPVGDGIGILRRILLSAVALSQQLTPDERSALSERTGGRISGIAVVGVMVSASDDIIADTQRAIDATERLKDAGTHCADRDLCGAFGTIIAQLEKTL